MPALVLKVGDYPLHHGGLGVARSLGRLGVPVHAVVEDRIAPLARSRYVVRSYPWRNGSLPDEDLVTGLRDIAAVIGSRSVLIATDDRAAALVAERRDELAEAFVLPHVPPALPRLLASKAGLFQTCRANGVPTVETCLVTSPDELDRVPEALRFPVVVKPSEGWRVPRGSGLKRTSRVASVTELRALYAALVASTGSSEVVVQQLVADGQDWIFHACCDSGSRCLVSWTGVKLRSYPVGGGLTTYGRELPNEELRQQAEELLRVMGYVGVVDLDYRFDPQTGRYLLLDFNPRVGAQFRLFEDDAGLDVVRALHLDLTGRAVAAGRMTGSRSFVTEFHDHAAVRELRRRGAVSFGAWAQAVNADERAWFALDDPWPPAFVLARALTALAPGRKPRSP